MDFWVEFFMSIIGVVMACGTIPQIIKLYKRKSSDDISLLSWVWVLFGQISWLGYGIYIKSPSLIIVEIAWIIAGVTIIYLTIKYSKKNINIKELYVFYKRFIRKVWSLSVKK